MTQPISLTGIYGGAFDPVHDGHVYVMRMALCQLSLSRLVVVPTGTAPHKSTRTAYEHRVAMLRLATQDMPVVVDLIEQHWQGPCYSADVLPVLEQRYGSIVNIIGGDSLCDMPTWHCPQQVMRYPHAVISRGLPDQRLYDAASFARRQYGAQLTILSGNVTLSSTDIRLAYRLGFIPHRPLCEDAAIPPLLAHYGVAPAVHDYIVQHGLYHDYAYITDRVPTRISPSRWAHSQQVALMALRLDSQLGLPEEQVITAALLHDCAKGIEVIHPAVPSDVLRHPAVVHAFNGAEEARLCYGVTDPDVLNAIRYHTTGRPDMSPLERLIYVADLVEDTRDYPTATELRALCLADFEQGFIACVRRTHDYLLTKNTPAHPLGEACYDYYVKQQ